ncbi:MAG: GntR family transcriptional regulator [Actinomycetota bacterium]
MAVSETRTDEVYRRIRTDILGGRIEPGSQMQFARMKTEYGASVGVLREALMRLSAEGLTVNQAQLGFRVMELSLDDLVDLTETRCAIESLVIRDSVANGDLEWESRVVAAHYRMEKTDKYDPGDTAPVTPAWADSHHLFHMALVSAAKSRRLIGIAASLRASAEVYRHWSMPFESEKRDVEAEHRELLDLCLKRDADGAAEALARHLRLTRDLILNGSRGSRQ